MVIERASLMVDSLNALNEAVQDTIETLAYTEALPVEAGTYPRMQPPFYITTVAVKRPYSGRIRLKISQNLGVSLVASMLGSKDLVDEAWVKDGLSELVNTIGGRILARLVDSYSSFDLGMPETVFVEKESDRLPEVLVRQGYSVNECFMELELELKNVRAA